MVASAKDEQDQEDILSRKGFDVPDTISGRHELDSALVQICKHRPILQLPDEPTIGKALRLALSSLVQYHKNGDSARFPPRSWSLLKRTKRIHYVLMFGIPYLDVTSWILLSCKFANFGPSSTFALLH
ncbi:uncharacterized protein C8R40DRAFT_1070715 [Lentinula edodes]|uniref:uncharacterized protein n=1 Tax=Lentinula edodes TaxID=5353 RepID=UPI001E8E1F58|nr:uncharacterized protein C8R40DRAFT_1070715 [Lentinula edodes]KAH7873881.1 hypothetical protein C8R40DRAFT_1070715 [Lentinula edodes]